MQKCTRQEDVDVLKGCLQRTKTCKQWTVSSVQGIPKSYEKNERVEKSEQYGAALRPSMPSVRTLILEASGYTVVLSLVSRICITTSMLEKSIAVLEPCIKFLARTRIFSDCVRTCMNFPVL